MLKTLLLVGACELLALVGQILFKTSANALDRYDLRQAKGFITFLQDVLSEPKIWLGLVSMAASLVFWILALASAELSVVFSLGSLQYVLILLSASYFLGEKIDLAKIAGTSLIVFGIVLVVLSK